MRQRRPAGSPSLADRLRDALPSSREAITGTLVWSAGMALTAFVSLWLTGWKTPHAVFLISLLFAAGGAVAFAPALFVARLLSVGRPRQARFAAGFLAFAAGTLFLTGLIYGIRHQIYVPEGHEEEFGAGHVVLVLLSAYYRFALFAAPLYLPLGFFFLFVASLWHARRSR